MGVDESVHYQIFSLLIFKTYSNVFMLSVYYYYCQFYSKVPDDKPRQIESRMHFVLYKSRRNISECKIFQSADGSIKQLFKNSSAEYDTYMYMWLTRLQLESGLNLIVTNRL